MIANWGTWHEFQSLLRTLFNIAGKHNASLANVATRWVLQQKAVGAVIVGTRLGVSNRNQDNLKVFGWQLDEEDLRLINAAAMGPSKGRMTSVYKTLGDCGNEYRALK